MKTTKHPRRKQTEKHSLPLIAVFLVFCALCAGILRGLPPAEEAKQLYSEATRILRSASGAATDPKVYAKAVLKLERAQKLIEEAAKTDPKGVERLQEEINAALFWARKFSTLPMIREIEKSHSKTDPDNTEPREEPDTEPDKEPPAPDSEKAEELFRRAEAFERSHENDQYAVAMRWFQVADQTAGTDWSLRAMSRAREAQARYKAEQEAKEKDAPPQSEDEVLIAEGNKLFGRKKYNEALAKFRGAQKIKNTTLVQQRIGHTYLEMGYDLRDQYAKQYLPLLKRFNKARRRGDQRRLAYLRRQAQAMVIRLRPLEQKIISHYKNAEEAFRRGLALADGRDLDCEAHLAILQFQRKQRKTARRQLKGVLKKYTPGNDEERTVYEYCKSLLKFLRG